MAESLKLLKKRLKKELFHKGETLFSFWEDRLKFTGRSYSSFLNQLAGRVSMDHDSTMAIRKFLDSVTVGGTGKTPLQIRKENEELKSRLNLLLKKSGRNFRWFHGEFIRPTTEIGYQTFLNDLAGYKRIRPELKKIVDDWIFQALNWP